RYAWLASMADRGVDVVSAVSSHAPHPLGAMRPAFFVTAFQASSAPSPLRALRALRYWRVALRAPPPPRHLDWAVPPPDWLRWTEHCFHRPQPACWLGH